MESPAEAGEAGAEVQVTVRGKVDMGEVEEGKEEAVEGEEEGELEAGLEEHNSRMLQAISTWSMKVGRLQEPRMMDL